jgi:hypothetical protein
VRRRDPASPKTGGARYRVNAFRDALAEAGIRRQRDPATGMP